MRREKIGGRTITGGGGEGGKRGGERGGMITGGGEGEGRRGLEKEDEGGHESEKRNVGKNIWRKMRRMKIRKIGEKRSLTVDNTN